MKLSIKILALAAAAAATQTVHAAYDDMQIRFYTSSDSYADGTPVKDNEWYGLVWIADDVEFKGFNADCSLVNKPEEAVFIMAGQFAENGGVHFHDGGGCFSVRRQDYTGRLDKGTWNLVLFDTRTPVMTPEGLSYAVAEPDPTVGYRPKSVNSWGVLATFSDIELKNPPKQDVKESVQIPVANTSALPSYPDGVDPIITGFDPVNGELTVGNTFSYIWYDVVGGSTPGTFEAKKNLAVEPKPGQTGSTIKLKVKMDGESKFFRVIRHLPQEDK